MRETFKVVSGAFQRFSGESLVRAFRDISKGLRSSIVLWGFSGVSRGVMGDSGGSQDIRPKRFQGYFKWIMGISGARE